MEGRKEKYFGLGGWKVAPTILVLYIRKKLKLLSEPELEYAFTCIYKCDNLKYIYIR